MKHGTDIYSFVLRGWMSQTAVERATTQKARRQSVGAERIEKAMPRSGFDKDFLDSAEKMAVVYTTIAAFENSARKFIQDRLIEAVGADWWDKAVPESARKDAEKRKEEEKQHRYHGSRGTSMIFFCQMGDLPSIVQNNWQHFQDHLPSIEWARQIFKSVERSRNVIMHAGELTMNDMERVAMNVRDWLEQVGG